MAEPMPSGAEASDQIQQLACLMAQAECPEGTVDTWGEDEWNVFNAGAFFGQAAAIMYFERHGMLSTNPEDPS
jgi:hypothetical protein